MKKITSNNGKILLLEHNLSHITQIADYNKGKRIDLLHIRGVDPEGREHYLLEEACRLTKEMSEINKVYICDARGLVERFKNSVDPEQLLGGFQLRYIIQILIWAYFTKAGSYVERIYYRQYIDHRLNEIPAKTILDDPDCICLMNEERNSSPADLLAIRFFVSQALKISDDLPEYGYTMNDKDIRKLCREIRQSHALETLRLEEIEYKNIDNCYLIMVHN
ncbi:MAG: hypothetical protein IKD84_00190 [Erysipelotrichaceae bacterium]|nr:hypothetical protein [Erysipelotrichaceae bacterium]